MKSLGRSGSAVYALLAVLAPLVVFGHGDDPKIRDFRGPIYANPYRAAEGGAPDETFETMNMTLMSWFPLNSFGTNAQSGNSCWGYTTASGREYAIMGLSNATAFVEVTDPGNSKIVATIPAPNSLWHDMKVYQGRVYVVSEAGSGIQVIDARDIDNGVVKLINTVTTPGTEATHTVAINEESGYLYRCGGGSNGLRIYSLADPNNPTWVASWSTRYIHECQVVSYTSGPFAGREIVYACSGFNGGWQDTRLELLDVTNKSNIFQVSEVYWPQAGYSHQIWLTPDKQYAYLNDELDEQNFGLPSTTVMFDVSDINNPKLLGKFNNGNPAIGHNLYVRDNLIFEANYRSGLHVFDISNPVAPVEVAWIDTYPENDNPNFNGAWSNYPFFASGTILISDIERGLFVVKMGGAELTFEFPDGIPAKLSPGSDAFKVKITSATTEVKPGSEKLHYEVGGVWTSSQLTPLGGGLYSAVFSDLPCGEKVDFYLAAETVGNTLYTHPIGAPNAFHSALAAFGTKTAAMDDLETDKGWVVGAPGDTATTGIWTRVDPIGTAAQPEDDHTPDPAKMCFVTGQGSPGGSVGENDVDNGKTTLTTPAISLSGLNAPVIAYWRWYSNNQGVQDDVFRIDLTANNGQSWVNVETLGPGGTEVTGGWRYHEFAVDAFAPGATSVKLRFVAEDINQGSIVEAAVDDLQVLEYACTNDCPADLDGDGVVGQSDLGILLADYGCTPSLGVCVGDIDGDNDTDQADLGALLSAYGMTCP